MVFDHSRFFIGIFDGETCGPAKGVIDGTTEGVLNIYTLGPAKGIAEDEMVFME